ncbi:MFS transporter [Rhodococcus erythropolis]|nr:MFS transporter [Rhodococcus erythropolis]THJ65311.1 MFS transporter [Rhodococcus qingshengii]
MKVDNRFMADDIDSKHHTSGAKQFLAEQDRGDALPLVPLLALFASVFITSLTETLPAGVLPAMSEGLDVSESAAGQTIMIYALGTALTTIPLVAVTASWSRKVLLLNSILGFAFANTVTAFSSDYLLTMTARFTAGVAAGIAWALLAGYARSLAPKHLEGRAIAFAMAGIPLALALGVPFGTYLGNATGWRAPFYLISILAVALLVAIAVSVPDRPGRPRGRKRRSMLEAARIPGVDAVLIVTFIVVLGHTILYAYIAPFLESIGMGDDNDLVLLTFGVACLISIVVVGKQIYARLRTFALLGAVLISVAATALAVATEDALLVYIAAAVWGLGWGGIPTLLQTSAAVAAGSHADEAQAVLTTLWNAAMAAGAVMGGVLLSLNGARSLPWWTVALALLSVVIMWTARGDGFRSPAQIHQEGQAHA